MDNKFKELVSIYSPSGAEEEMRNYLKGKLQNYADKIEEDVLGNLIVYKNGSFKENSKTIMIIAHMDEVSMMVSCIEDNGFIRITKVGGLDVNLMRSRSIVILHEKQLVHGVIGTIPYHMLKDAPKKEWEFTDLWVDIGASQKEDAEKLVSVGDYVIVDAGYDELSDSNIHARACDNKAGVFALCNVLEQISSIELNMNVVAVFSAQEEVGLRGAEVSAYSLKPDVCIVVDAAHATDYPCVCKAKYGDVRIGGGPVIPLGTSFSNRIQRAFISIAQSKEIRFQRLALPAFSGTDATAVQTSGKGCLTGLISIPCRYMHSPYEVISMDDVNDCIELLVSMIVNYANIGDVSWLP